MQFVKDVLILHECHRSVNILVFRDPLPPILILMFCSLCVWSWRSARRVSPASSPVTSVYLFCASSTKNALSRCFSTSRTSDVAPKIAMNQILPLTNQCISVAGSSANWHSSSNSKASAAHPADILLLSLFLPHVPLSPLCEMGSAEFCKIWPPRVVLADPDSPKSDFPEILQFWIRAQRGLEIRSLRYTMNSKNWTPAN